MNNEQYLILSYFAIAAGSILLALVIYALLRRSLHGLSKTVFTGDLGKVLRKAFPLNLVLFALAGFFSVSLRGCNKESYESIVTDKAYLIAKNQEQIAATMLYLCKALLLFGLLVSICLAIIIKHGGQKR